METTCYAFQNHSIVICPGCFSCQSQISNWNFPRVSTQCALFCEAVLSKTTYTQYSTRVVIVLKLLLQVGRCLIPFLLETEHLQRMSPITALLSLTGNGQAFTSPRQHAQQKPGWVSILLCLHWHNSVLLSLCLQVTTRKKSLKRVLKLRESTPFPAPLLS